MTREEQNAWVRGQIKAMNDAFKHPDFLADLADLKERCRAAPRTRPTPRFLMTEAQQAARDYQWDIDRFKEEMSAGGPYDPEQWKNFNF